MTEFDFAVAGDANINRRVSDGADEGFLALIDPIRQATVSFTHLETTIGKYDGSEIYPAAEAGGTWQRAPWYVAEELNWAGFDIVSTPSNHALDYSYGGLRSTWTALDDAGIPHAGTGENLRDARSPTYLETPDALVAVVSMTSSFTPWSRAGDVRGDVAGRPGVNPLRYHHKVDLATLGSLKEVAENLGWWITNPQEGEWLVHPPALHNSAYRFVESDDDGTTTVPDKHDLAGNVAAVRDAAERADVVLTHLHSHEWDPTGDLSDPPAFVETVARDCIDAGADLFVNQGTHSPLRGIELYDGKPILHDPGDFFRMSDTVTRFPADFYYRYEHDLDVPAEVASPSDGLRARKGGRPDVSSGYNAAVNPPGGYHSASTMGNVVAVCRFEEGRVSRIVLYPGTWDESPSAAELGIPRLATGETAERVIGDVADLSAEYGTDARFEDGVGVVPVD
jgi:poly-gamma-glutamate synthesis protein (capsule biosynthesis protein)